MASATKETKATTTKAPGLEVRVARLAIEAGADEARAEARRILARLEAGEVPGHGPRPSEFGVSRAREAIEARVRAAARAALVDALASGGEAPAWSGEPDRAEVATGVLRWWRENNGLAGAVWLVDSLTHYLDSDRSELAEVRVELKEATPYHVLDGSRARFERMLTLEDRLSARTAALEAFHAEFKARVAGVLKKYRPAIESGLYENLALSGAHSPPVEAIESAEKRLAEARSTLNLLMGAAKIKAGPKSDMIRREVAELEARIPKLRAEQAARVEAEVRGIVDAAATGDLHACRGLAEAIGRAIDSFPEGCYLELQALGCEAMIAADAVVWAGALEGAVRGGPGREFV